jgi:hypothetical protein
LLPKGTLSATDVRRQGTSPRIADKILAGRPQVDGRGVAGEMAPRVAPSYPKAAEAGEDPVDRIHEDRHGQNIGFARAFVG